MIKQMLLIDYINMDINKGREECLIRTVMITLINKYTLDTNTMLQIPLPMLPSKSDFSIFFFFNAHSTAKSHNRGSQN